MGEEITSSRFRKQDFQAYEARLAQELKLLEQWFAEGRFDSGPSTGGFELEAWLVDRTMGPAAINVPFLELLDSPMVVPELSAFNVELNTTPRLTGGDTLARMAGELHDTWSACRETAFKLDADVLMIGILPTVRESQLALANMSQMTRYKALNEQVMRVRKGEPIRFDISGRDILQTQHHDVMLEAAATSFQLHLKVAPEVAVRHYNASIILSAPMVALCANSPYLFGRDLWDETRIPLFEQAVAVGSPSVHMADRVTFGNGYARDSLFEVFADNSARYPVLLPEVMGDAPETLHHLRLHNGTIWRWNRPLVGFNDDGTPHLRIEHRVVAAGPSEPDAIANAAMFFGLVHALATQPEPPEQQLSFEQARANFYAAAKNGFNATVEWPGGRPVKVLELLQEELLPLAREGLQQQGFDSADIAQYLGIIEGRLKTRCNGTAWQRGWVARHGNDMIALTTAYAEQQHGGAPVHEWTL